MMFLLLKSGDHAHGTWQDSSAVAREYARAAGFVTDVKFDLEDQE
jgi:hypothetical protein